MSGILGFSYKSSNKNTDVVIRSAQNVIKSIQNLGCQTIIPQIIYEINNQPNDPNFPTDPKTVTDQFISGTLKNIVDGLYKQTNNLALTNELSKSIKDTFQLFVNNSTIKGKVDQNLIKKNMIDFYSSFCPGNTMGKYQPPANDKIITYNLKTMKPDGSFIQWPAKVNYGSSVIIGGIVYTYDDLKKIGIAYGTDIPTITIDLQGAPSPFPANASSTPPPANTSSPVLASLPPPPVTGPTGLVSTFGAMKDDTTSTFGSMASGFLIFIVLLLIVGGVIYYLHSKGKVKIPGLPQRIAAFGRQIKAIRKM